MTTTTPIVHVIDDDDSFRTAIARVLQFAGHRVKEYASAGAFLLHETARDAPGCILLDLRMPGPSGLELHEAIAGNEGALPVIFISGHADVNSSVRAMNSGAVDFLTTPVDRDTLLSAVNRAIARDAQRRTQSDRRHELAARYATLLPREREVFAQVVAGKLNKQIAAMLGIAERTVKAHRAQVMLKMQAASVAELTLLAERLRTDGATPTVQ